MKTKLTKEWSPYNGDYEKKMQDITLKNGEVYLCCWPNANTWHCDKCDPIPNDQVLATRLTHNKAWQYD